MTQPIHCQGCGQPFTPGSISILGMTISTNYCPSCTDSSEHGDTLQPVRKRRRTLEGWAQVCPPLYASVVLGQLPDPARSLYARVTDWKISPQGFALVGPSRTGKSMLLHALAQILWMENADLHLTFGSEFAWRCGDYNQDNRRREIDRCINCQVLVMDDIDKGKLTDRVEADLFHVLEMRQRYQRPLHCTLNLSPEELKTCMSGNRGEPILNRLKEHCEFLAIA